MGRTAHTEGCIWTEIQCVFANASSLGGQNEETEMLDTKKVSTDDVDI